MRKSWKWALCLGVVSLLLLGGCGKEKAEIFKFPAQWYFFLFTLSWILGILMKYLCINCIF